MKLTKAHGDRLRELKTTLRLPMNRIVNEILEKHFTGQMKEAAAMKVTEVEVMVSKKRSVNFNSCCVSYTARATLDENNPGHLEALATLKDQLVAKVQEAVNGKGSQNNHHHDNNNEQKKGGQP